MNQIRRWMKAGLKLAALSRCKLETSAFERARRGVKGRLKASSFEPVQPSTSATKAGGASIKAGGLGL